MWGSRENPDLRDNLADLQEKSLRIITLFVGAAGYIWFGSNYWSLRVTREIHSQVPTAAWIGCGVLVLGVLASFALKDRHLQIATHALVWGILTSTACAVLAFPSPATIYLFVLPIIFASVLLSQAAFLLVAIVASLLSLVIGPMSTGLSLFSADIALPVVIIVLVAVTSWLSAHNLYTALEWVWNGYERARRNERMAREQRAELQRVLKALDEAYYKLERANSMLVVARDEAEEARRLKQQFAQNVSHELRTPLGIIIGFSETMANAPETYGDMVWPPALRGDVEQIYRSSRHLSSLIDDILDLSALEARRLKLAMQEVDVGAVIREAVLAMESLFLAKRLYLKVNLAADLPRLRLDPLRIRQVLFNLLNNASRFTYVGGVTIAARLAGQDVQVAVADTGVGIASQDVPRVFEEFSQVDGSTHRPHDGTGLGMPLSKRLIELHGGRMWLESTPGRGTTFYFTLPTLLATPVAITYQEGIPARPAPSHPACRKGLLVAEPDSMLLHTLRRHVDGYDVVAVPKHGDLTSLAETYQPVALAVDSQDQNVFATLQRWSADVPPDLPLIAFPMRDSLGNAQALGVADYLIKPITRPQLMEAIGRLGNVRSVLLVDDDPQLVELLGRMLESSGEDRHIAKVYGGEDALASMRLHRPDLVLLDLMMPEVDGLSVLATMRSDPSLAEVPVIVVTAREYMEMEASGGGHTLGMIRRAEFSAAELLNCFQSLLDALPLRMPSHSAPAPAYSPAPDG